MKKFLIAIIVILIVIQFIRPERNEGNAVGPNEIAQIYPVPEPTYQVLQDVCYDCHSNHTDYPWYINFQPVGWWLQHHIDEGKEHLNFSEFGTYTKKKQAHKLEETVEMVTEGEMPLESYTWIHKEARLTDAQREIVVNWAKALQTQLEQE